MESHRKTKLTANQWNHLLDNRHTLSTTELNTRIKEQVERNNWILSNRNPNLRVLTLNDFLKMSGREDEVKSSSSRPRKIKLTMPQWGRLSKLRGKIPVSEWKDLVFAQMNRNAHVINRGSQLQLLSADQYKRERDIYSQSKIADEVKQYDRVQFTIQIFYNDGKEHSKANYISLPVFDRQNYGLNPKMNRKNFMINMKFYYYYEPSPIDVQSDMIHIINPYLNKYVLASSTVDGTRNDIINVLRRDRKDSFMNVLKMISEDIYNKVEAALISEIDCVVYISDHKSFNVDDTSYDVGNEMLRKDHYLVQRNKIYELSIADSFKNSLPCHYKSDYVKKHFIPDSCVFSTYLDIYYEKFRTNKKRLAPISYEILFKLVHPDLKIKDFIKQNNGLPCTLNQFIPVLRKYRHAWFVYDAEQDLVWKYDPRDENLLLNRDITPAAQYYRIQNGHLFYLDNEVKALEKQREFNDTYETSTEISEKVNLRVMDEKEMNESFYGLFESLDMWLQDIIENPEINRFVYISNTTLSQLVMSFIQQYSLYPKINIDSSNSINSLSLYGFKYQGRDLELHIQVIPNIAGRTLFGCDFQGVDIREFYKMNEVARVSVMNIQTVSWYHPDTLKIFKRHNLGGIWGKVGVYSEPKSNEYLRSIPREEIDAIYEGCEEQKQAFLRNIQEDEQMYELDFNKFYSHGLQTLEYLPVVSSGDIFVKYKGEPLEPYSFYIVDWNTRDNYARRDTSMTMGFNLIQFCTEWSDDCIIREVLKPHMLIKNNFSKILKQIYENEQLPLDVKKHIVNKLIGQCGQGYRKRQNFNYFTEENECNDFLSKKIQKIILESGDTTLYCTLQKFKRPLINGFMPIRHCVVDWSYGALYKLCSQLAEHDIHVHSIKTDAVIFNTNPSTIDKFVKQHTEYFDYENKDSYQAIGKLKLPKIVNIFELPEYYKPRIDYEDDADRKNIGHVETIPIEDEYDEEEIFDIIKNNDRLQINAYYPGGGKSTSMKNYVKQFNKKALFVCPMRKQMMNFQEQGFESVTCAYLFGMEADNTRPSACNPNDYEIIVFEEIYQNDVQTIQKIYNLSRTFKGQMFTCGDPNQMEPCEKPNNVTDMKNYQIRFVNIIFPKQVVLYEIKRATCDAHRYNSTLQDIKYCPDCIRNRTETKMYYDSILKAKSVKEAIESVLQHSIHVDNIENICAEQNISLTNECRMTVNGYYHKRKYGSLTHLEKGMEFLGNITHYITVENKQKVKIAKHRSYRVEEVKKNTVILNDDAIDPFEISFSKLWEYFCLPYVMTCFGVQGETLNGDVCIFDIDHRMVTIPWLYVAVSRNRDFRKNMVYTGQRLYKPVSVQDMKKVFVKRVTQHKKEDRITKRSYDEDEYITSDFLEKQFYLDVSARRCPDCHELLDLKNMSIDRLDPDIAHVKTNVRFCCHECNIKKGPGERKICRVNKDEFDK